MKVLVAVIAVLAVLATLASSAQAFSLPDIKKGLALKTIGRYSITPTIEIELYEFDFRDLNYDYDLGFVKGDFDIIGETLGEWTVDAGIGHDLVLVSLDRTIVPVIELQVGVFVGYDFDRYDGGFEAGFGIKGILW